MFRALMTIVTAAAVLWHTVAGCCAHHSHGRHSYGGGDAVLLGQDGDPQICGGCCQHAQTDVKQFSAAELSSHQIGEGSTGIPCPDDGPIGCPDDTCVFAAPSSSGPSTIDLLGGDGSFPGFAVVEPVISFGVSRAGELHDSVALPSLGGLRLHLAHCVLTL